ncbi:MAG: cation:proton antiporter [Dehalococcoidales bacterium]|nr:cation:proton antiporter [Dehalococcoidales bacterium]
MTTDLALAIGVMIVVGFFGGKLAKKLKLPRITGYIVVGLLLSPSALNLVPRATIESLNIVTSVALGIIAYAIGGSLRLGSIRRLGRSIAWITMVQALAAWLIVTLVVVLLAPLILNVPQATVLRFYFPMAFIIGAIACATDPATILAVTREYRAKGPLTTTLLALVAIDDAVAVIAFAIAVGVAQPLVSGIGGASFYQMLGVPFLGVIESVGIGTAFGFALVYITRLTKTRALLLMAVLGIITLCTGVANMLGVSLIMANMAVGFVVTNRMAEDEPFIVVEGVDELVFAVFFVLAGMHFDFDVMKVVGVMVLLIFATRFAGKYYGARIGAGISHAEETVKKYAGFALLPQAGVAMGLALLARNAFPAFGDIILNATLAVVIINQLISPPMVKHAIFKAGEAAGMGKPVPDT